MNIKHVLLWKSLYEDVNIGESKGQFLSFSCSYRPLHGLAPSSGKSWIRHWLTREQSKFHNVSPCSLFWAAVAWLRRFQYFCGRDRESGGVNFFQWRIYKVKILDAHPHFSAQLSSFSCSLWRNLAEYQVGTLPLLLTFPLGNPGSATDCCPFFNITMKVVGGHLVGCLWSIVTSAKVYIWPTTLKENSFLSNRKWKWT